MDGLTDDEIMWWVIAMDCKLVGVGPEGVMQFHGIFVQYTNILNQFNCILSNFFLSSQFFFP